MKMFAAVYVGGGGVIHHVEIGDDLVKLIDQAKGRVGNDFFNPDYESMQIWNEIGSVVFDYETDVYTARKQTKAEISALFNILTKKIMAEKENDGK